jgi:hypothetical protein
MVRSFDGHLRGKFKRETQLWIMRIAFGIVAGANVDTLAITSYLYEEAMKHAPAHLRMFRPTISGSSGESVGNLRVSALGLSDETVKLAAGGVEGALLVFPAVVDQRPTVLMDHVADE